MSCFARLFYFWCCFFGVLCRSASGSLPCVQAFEQGVCPNGYVASVAVSVEVKKSTSKYNISSVTRDALSLFFSSENLRKHNVWNSINGCVREKV